MGEFFSGHAASPDERLALSVGRLVRGWMRLGREQARRFDISFPQMMLLRNLRESGPIPVTRWAEMVGASPSATTGLLDSLEERRIVRRVRDTGDRRQIRIALTPTGRRLTQRLMSLHEGRWRELCEGIPAARLESASATLDEIAARLVPLPIDEPPAVPARTAARRRGARAAA